MSRRILHYTDLTENLAFTDTGTVWATWRLEPQKYGYAPFKKRSMIKKLHEDLFQSLRGESMLMGITASLDPSAMVEAMIEGVDPEQCPHWFHEVAKTLESWDDIEFGTRTFWLSIPLKSSSFKETLRRHGTVLRRKFHDALALPGMSPDLKLLESSSLSSTQALKNLPTMFRARPATPEEHVWLALHHMQRGLYLDEAIGLHGHDKSLVEGQAQIIPEPWMDQGAQTDPREENKDRIFRRRYIKVAASTEPSYQQVLAIRSMPLGGFEFPGGEWMSAIDQLAFPVDWVWRFTTIDAREAKKQNATNESRLNDQRDQRTDESVTGSNAELDVHQRDLQLYQQALSRNEKEVSITPTVLLAVGGSSAEEVTSYGKQIIDFYKQMEVGVEAPLPKLMEELWKSMMIGTPMTPIVKEYALPPTTSYDLSASIPIASDSLGAERGPMLGINTTGGRRTPVLHDIESAVMGNKSGCFAVVAELGAGKTLTLKKITAFVAERGGRYLVIDKSATHEWLSVAGALDKKGIPSTAINLVEPEYSLDPLRVFGVEEGASHVESLAAMLMNISPSDEMGIVLNEMLNPVHLEEHGIDSLGKLVEFLQGETDDPEQRRLGRTMQAFSKKKQGRVLFDETLPPLNKDARGIVFCTYGLELPSPEELSQGFLFKQLSLEKIYGRALYALIARIAHQVCFEDDSDLALFMASEAHHLTSNPQGLEIVNSFLREGRKAKAVLGMDSHDPVEFGDKRGLIPFRILMRHTDEEEAKKGLAFLGLDPDDEEKVEKVRGFSPQQADGKIVPGREGEAMIIDQSGNHGEIKVTLPADPEIAAAILTTPQAARIGG
ncbi:ATP-binding protein [Glutamicibacter sp. NPDC127525]|uniref:ATP-binding protein n=1 Tax=unclassified Glutamicibacter TaxID=2627139 RepID=UPI0036384F6B